MFEGRVRGFSERCASWSESSLTVVPVDADRLSEALDSPMKDFEDAVQVACARTVDVRFLVTRNLKDFRKAGVPVASLHAKSR